MYVYGHRHHFCLMVIQVNLDVCLHIHTKCTQCSVGIRKIQAEYILLILLMMCIYVKPKQIKFRGELLKFKLKSVTFSKINH